MRSRSELTALMRRDRVSGWSQGIAVVSTVAEDPIAANRTARKCASENFARSWSSIGVRLDQKSNAIIFFIIATPIPIQQIAITEIMRPWLVVHNNETYLGDEK